jgi:two-component system, chemotaxis family, protein-glutamate methylesterase/glutaminase
MIKVLVIDDSAFNRQTLTSMLESAPGIRVVARAGDGDEGLKQVFAHAPDVITLDLEMPRMDGFTFLRILMARRPTPVIVISSQTRKDNIFKALELGALDFIAKPTKKVSHELTAIGEELIAKVRMITQLRMVSLAASAERSRDVGVVPIPAPPAEPTAPLAAPTAPTSVMKKLVVVGASTGGPAALAALLAELVPSIPIGVLIAQHMPAKFTQAFAERLDKLSPLEVREARGGDLVRTGLALVAPGASMMTVRRSANGLRVVIEPPTPDDRFVPSIDRLFESAAEVMGPDVIGVILTGMAGEGARATRAVAGKGGDVIVEAAESAVMLGMPEEAMKTGLASEIVPLGMIASAIVRRIRK